MSLWNKRVLALMPHPDDIEILCAGTLIRLQELGWEIHLATMTAGDCGSDILPPSEISAIRRQEAAAAAEVIGATSYTCLDFSDFCINFDTPSRRKVTGFMRTIDPVLVFTTPQRDYMFDHEITSQLVRDACFTASCRNYADDTDSGLVSSGVPYLYYSDAIGGHDILGQPSLVSCYVDISYSIEQKAEALQCHESQRIWLKKQHGVDNYLTSMREWSAMRGAEVDVAYAEGFGQHLGHPYPLDDLLSEALGS
jgi:LmbE family N-acetylglucosaminyl deacetylase